MGSLIVSRTFERADFVKMLRTRLEIFQEHELNGLLIFVVSSVGLLQFYGNYSNFVEKSFRRVTLDPGKRQMDILLLADSTIEGASPSHARQE